MINVAGKIHYRVDGEPYRFKLDGRAYLETCCDYKEYGL